MSDTGKRGADESETRRELERERAARVAIGQLEQRDIHVQADADPEVIAQLLEAVERFEGVVAALGGDSMVNTLDSSDPPRPQFVIPQQWADEGLRSYAARIRQSADRLTGR